MVKALTIMTITSFFEHPENKQYENNNKQHTEKKRMDANRPSA
jgi:hypothetical protein